ncbi:MAG: SAM-dependent methyltransferase [Cyclobacteriaceae bacterium]
MTDKGRIYLIPTIISPDTESVVLPPQIFQVIKSLDYFLVENVRTARRFISSLKLGLEIGNLQFELLNKHTSPKDISTLIEPVKAGRSIGVLSESGCPGVADPGAMVVEMAHRQSITVVPLVGPSSLLLALMASGFNGQSFTFHGYLPIDKNDRVKKIKALEVAARNGTQIFIETPYRNQQMFESIVQSCRGDTLLCVAKNLTAQDSWVKTRSINQWKKNQPAINKIPVVFLLGRN